MAEFIAHLDADHLIVWGGGAPADPVVEAPASANLDLADQALRTYGFERSEPWTLVRTYQGMELEADLVKIT